jgi:uncharacterized surface anchored protein
LRQSLPVRLFWLLLAACAACGAAQTPHRPTVGSIAGLVRDHDSGTVIAQAGIHVRAAGDMTRHDARSNADGHYAIGQLRPGRYSLDAEFAGQPIDVEDIAVRAGNATIVDLTFTLGRPDAVHVDFGNAREGAIDRYKPPALAASAGRIEGTVNQVGTRDRIGGAVVMASGQTGSALETVSDDQGRYRFDDLAPGVYTVSAYYSIGGRGQIEIRRSEIQVAGGTAVVVPLWVEVAR